MRLLPSEGRMLDPVQRCTFLREKCWVWTKSKFNNGYGFIPIRVNGVRKNLLVHRVIWERLYGPIENGLILHHKCKNRLCYNPYHLRIMSTRAHQLLERPIFLERG